MNSSSFAFNNFFSCRQASNSASDSFFSSFVVVLLDFSVVFSSPVDEYANRDKQIVSFVSWDCAVFYTVSNSHSNTTLCWTKHLNCLLRTFDCYFVEHNSRRFNHQVRSNNSQQAREAVFVVC